MFQKYTKIAILISLFSCKTESSMFPLEPVINLEKVEQFQNKGKDSAVLIKLGYTDGDGDIGLNPNDTFPPFNFGSPYFYNLIVKVFEVKNGVEIPIMIPLTTDTIFFNDRIANLTPTGKNKSISGTISVNLNAIPYPGILPDTMIYKLKIMDRNLNISNEVVTQPLRFVR
jgi:hypothetical protein